MTLAQQIAASAHRLMIVAPEEAQRLLHISARVRRIELALDEIVADAMESAELAEASAVVVAFPGRY